MANVQTLEEIELERVRRYFAEEIRAVCNLRSEALVEALASTPRERFLGPGPWKIRGVDTDMGAQAYPTASNDPRHVYHNVSIAIDLRRQLFNGQPGTVAFWIDSLRLQPGERVLHVGCGTGYYTALMANVVGPSGRVTAFEIDPELAARASVNLKGLDCVEVRTGDATRDLPEKQDAILINAGATHPLAVWLDSLRIGGRLLLPITLTLDIMPQNIGKGGVFLITREENQFSARFVSLVAIFSCAGARDEEINSRLQAALSNRGILVVRRLRRDAHEPDSTCWLHGDGFCFSTQT